MQEIRWNTTKRDRETIRKIAQRAHNMSVEQSKTREVYSVVDAQMDITACHLNGCRLRLDDLLNADSFNFAHDVFGIRGHIDRNTGRMTDHFRPRFTKPKRAALAALDKAGA